MPISRPLPPTNPTKKTVFSIHNTNEMEDYQPPVWISDLNKKNTSLEHEILRLEHLDLDLDMDIVDASAKTPEPTPTIPLTRQQLKDQADQFMKSVKAAERHFKKYKTESGHESGYDNEHESEDDSGLESGHENEHNNEHDNQEDEQEEEDDEYNAVTYFDRVKKRVCERKLHSSTNTSSYLSKTPPSYRPIRRLNDCRINSFFKQQYPNTQS